MNCKSILVVEDHDDIRESVAEVLRMEGYRVYTAGNGQEALDSLDKIENPLILLDMMMPVMSGWEFLEARKAIPAFAKLPVVVVSAVPAEKALLPESGLVLAEGLLSKPINIYNLLKVVETYCEAPLSPLGSEISDAQPTQSL